jgi:hypothetical protein
VIGERNRLHWGGKCLLSGAMMFSMSVRRVGYGAYVYKVE